MKTKKIRFMVAILQVLFLAAITQAQTTEFTYQGKLTDGGNPAGGSYDLQFALFDGAGTQIGSPVTRPGTSVSGGIFTVQLDFGVSPFSGANRFLEISVRPAGVGSFTTLSPRQQISSTPYAIRTLNATAADSLSSACAACVQDAQINSVAGSKVSGTIPVASVPGGSGNYIQNTSSQQAGSNFNISGNGIIGGNVGIGTAAPGYPLDVNGPVRSLRNTSTDFVAQTTGGTNAWARFSMFTPSQSWAIGSSQNFSGNQFYLHDLTFAQNRFTVQPNGGAISFPLGNVGIGTTNPTAKLHVVGGSTPGITVTSEGNAVIGLSSTAGFAAIFGENTSGSSGFGVYGKGTTGFALYADGNAGQNRANGGLVKAIIYVLSNGLIQQCYNGLTGASLNNGNTTTGCGFSVNHFADGGYGINFGFQVNDRFIVVTAERTANPGLNNGANFLFLTNNTAVDVRTFRTDEVVSTTDTNFTIIVY